MKTSRCTVHSLLLSVLLALIAGVTFVGASLFYMRLHAAIIRSFELKLESTVGTASAFMDASALASLAAPKTVTSIASSDAGLFGLDEAGTLLSISPKHGGAAPIGKPGAWAGTSLVSTPGRAYPIAFDPARKLLLSVTPEGSRTTAPKAVSWNTPPGATCAAIGPKKQILFATESSILVADSATGHIETTIEGCGPCSSPAPTIPRLASILAVPASPPYLVGVAQGTSAWCVIPWPDPASAPSREPAAPAPTSTGEAPTPISGLAWHGDALYAAGSKLMKLDPLTGAPVADFVAMPGYPDPEHPAYRAYRKPLLQLHKAEGLTYLYAFVRRSDSAINYLVDAVEDDTWLPVGTEDTLPEANRAGLDTAWAEERIFVSDILDFGRWGLLKVAAAPLAGGPSGFRSFVGGDINISVIRARTRAALVQALGAGVVAVAVGSLLALWMARRITGPIEAARIEALAVAAGRAPAPHAHAGTRTDEISSFALALEETALALETRRAVRLHAGHAHREEALQKWIRDRLAAAKSPSLPATHPATDAPARDRVSDGGAHREEIASGLAACSLFSKLTRSELHALGAHTSRRTFAPGEIICPARRPLPAFYWVISGRVSCGGKTLNQSVDIPAIATGWALAEPLVAGERGADCLVIPRGICITILRDCPEIALEAIGALRS